MGLSWAWSAAARATSASSFGEMIAHVAASQMLMCGVVKGEKSIANAQLKPAKCPSFRCGSKRVAFRRHSVCRFEKTAFTSALRPLKPIWLRI
jgi:hypothetical protein